MIRDTALRRARLARGLTVDDVAARTRLSPRLVTLLDEGRFDELPGGLYARSYVRAFATATGIDPNTAVARVEPLLPDVPDPVAAIRESIGGALDTPPIAAALERVWSTTRSRVAASVARLARRDALPDVASRSAIAVADTLVLAAINLILVGGIAAFCGTTLPHLLGRAGGAIGSFCAVMSMLYYVLLAGIGGHTPGAWLCDGPASAAEGPLRPAAILKRAGLAWLDAASIVVDLLLNADRAARDGSLVTDC